MTWPVDILPRVTLVPKLVPTIEPIWPRIGLAGLGDAGELSLDIGREYRNPGARKSLSHHLQRDGFSSSGSTGDEAMAVCKRKRQPCRRFALAYENLLVGIGHRVIGRRHCIASSRAAGVSAAGRQHHIACCRPIEPGQRLPRRSETGRQTDRPALHLLATKVATRAGPRQFGRAFRAHSCIAATLVMRSKLNRAFACGRRL